MGAPRRERRDLGALERSGKEHDVVERATSPGPPAGRRASAGRGSASRPRSFMSGYGANPGAPSIPRARRSSSPAPRPTASAGRSAVTADLHRCGVSSRSSSSSGRQTSEPALNPAFLALEPMAGSPVIPAIYRIGIRSDPPGRCPAILGERQARAYHRTLWSQVRSPRPALTAGRLGASRLLDTPML